MFRLYCLPGMVIAQLGYLFPRKGQVRASARRKDSGFAHFIFATAFWAFLLLLFGRPLAAGLEQVTSRAVVRTDPAAAGPVSDAVAMVPAGEGASSDGPPLERRGLADDAPPEPQRHARRHYPRCSASVTDNCMQ